MSVKKLFGKNIPPSCEYCQFSVKKRGGSIICRYGIPSDDHERKKYIYDPLKREPKSLPKIPRFTADDFKL